MISTNSDKLMLILILLFSITTIILLIVLLTKEPKETKESKDPQDKKYLFFIRSNDAMTVNVKKSPSSSVTNQQQKHSGKYIITMPVSSKFSAFTDIPYHESHDLGDMSIADILFNNNSDKIPDNEEMNSLKSLIDKLSKKEPFISLEPNCTLSFTKMGPENTTVNHVNTIAKLTEMKLSFDGSEVDLTFEILDGNMLIPVGTYEYCSITVDDWFGDMFGYVAIAAAAVGATALCVTTGGSGCVAGAAGVAAVATAVSIGP